MLHPEKAAEILEKHRVKDWLERRLAAIGNLARPLRPIGWQLLGYDQHGQKFKAYDWQAIHEAHSGAVQQLEQLPKAERLAVFESLFPKLSVEIEAAWQLQKQFPYQLGGSRRAFRVPDRSALTLPRRSRWLSTIILVTSGYEEDVVWLATWAAYLSGYGWSAALGVLFAGAIEANTETSDQLFEILIASAKGEPEVATMGRHIIQGLLSASRPQGWRIVEQLLIAAQRQEGLRQVILESVDEAHPEAFRRMVRLIHEHNLVRFSSVIRAVDVWLGLQWNAAHARTVGQLLGRLDDFLHDHDRCLTSLSGDDPQQLYLALCVLAFDDAQVALAQALPLLAHNSLEVRFAALYFLVQLDLPEAKQALLPLIADQDLRVASVAFAAVQPNYDQELPTAEDLFEQLEAALPHFPAKKRSLEPLVWPWLDLAANRQLLANALPGALGKRPYRALFPYLELMDPWQRAKVIRELIAKDKRRRDPETRDILVKLLGDRSRHVRDAALEAVVEMKLETGAAQQLEGYLTRKTGDLRRGILAILLAQGDPAALTSAERLLAARHPLQRQAGLELLRQLNEKEEQQHQQQIQTLAHEYAGQHQPSEVDQTLLAAISDRRPEAATLDDGLGLFDPARRTALSEPKSQTGLFKKRTFSPTPAARGCIKSLDGLIHDRREIAITFNAWQDQLREELLGNVRWGFPKPDVEKSVDEDIARLPLAELWQSWWADRPAGLRDNDGFELFRALIVFERHGPYRPHHLLAIDFDRSPDWIKKATELLYGKIDQSTLRYGHITQTILWWLVRLSPPLQAVDFLLRGVEQSLYLVRRKKWLIDNNLERPDGLLGWLSLARQHRQLCPTAWQDDDHVRLWRLLRWLDQFSWAVGKSHAEIGEIMSAYHAGGATEADIFHHLIGPRKDDRRNYGLGANFDSLRGLSGSRPTALYRDVADDPVLRQCVARCRQRLVEVELQRGDVPTAASKAALALRQSGGMETLLQLLKAFGKENFERGWSYDSLSKKAVFSHLIRSTVPAESDAAENFAEQAKAFNLRPKRLVETAIYAPQWAAHIETSLEWPDFAEAVWWFHAHTKDHGWRIDQEIREVWQAEASERTPLSGQDLLDGAVDVAWFKRLYTALGPERWAELDRAARYASGGGGHKRAQLFAGAMLGQVEESTLIQRISEKRHQDAVRALGLLPLPLTDKQEEVMLQRYQLIQEFIRGSRKFGSQRQASEKLAAKIGLENLARTAGYPDPLRLEWAMEAQAVADLAAGPVTVSRGEVTVTLSIDEWAEPQLQILKKGRELKAVPAKLKKQPDIADLVSRRRDIKQQAARMRRSLEEAMCRSDSFTGAELQQLLTHPILKPMLTQLVFVGEAISGYPSDDGRQLIGLAGSVYPLNREATLRLAHPYDLLLTNSWHIWQTECFQHEVIQPFKQIFRELYVLTAGEKAEATTSYRYEGHQVNPRQALALLGRRGWVSHPEQGVRKTFHDEGLTVWLSFQNGYYTPAEVDGLTLEGVHFSRRGAWQALPLDQIPPRLFSEVMRDLDLVVSVAHQGGVDPEASASTVEMRAALIRETCGMLALANVRLKDNHALIEGHLNNYSIHLGSGVVHQQPGGYLCLVPVHSQRRGRLFLPFADDDPKSAEVMSKVLLLAQDKTIKDPTILEQILPRG